MLEVQKLLSTLVLLQMEQTQFLVLSLLLVVVVVDRQKHSVLGLIVGRLVGRAVDHRALLVQQVRVVLHPQQVREMLVVLLLILLHLVEMVHLEVVQLVLVPMPL